MNIYKIKLVKEELDSPYETQINSPKDAIDIIRSFIADKNDRECLIVLCLNTKNRTTGINLVSVGSINSSIVSPANVLKPAILSNAAAIILAHNHPSGDPTPSQEDRSATKRIKEASKIMGIDLLDHLIIGFDDHYSFKSECDI